MATEWPTGAHPKPCCLGEQRKVNSRAERRMGKSYPMLSYVADLAHKVKLTVRG